MHAIPPAAAALLCDHGQLRIDPCLCHSWRALAHSGVITSEPPAAARAVDQRLGAEVCSLVITPCAPCSLVITPTDLSGAEVCLPLNPTPTPKP